MSKSHKTYCAFCSAPDKNLSFYLKRALVVKIFCPGKCRLSFTNVFNFLRGSGNISSIKLFVDLNRFKFVEYVEGAIYEFPN